MTVLPLRTVEAIASDPGPGSIATAKEARALAREVLQYRLSDIPELTPKEKARAKKRPSGGRI